MFQVSITRPQEREFERTERLSACFQDSDFGSAAVCIIIVELIWLTLSAPGYLVWFWWENAFDMKFGTVILCYVTKKNGGKNFQNCRYRDDDITNCVNFSWKIMRKMAKIRFFSN